ncbi:His Kinase A (phospho-acceptor) domain-containing protein [Pseudoxanthomonas sp. GM95]|uniref:ATP-binding protein n=1 Tax=Pseudoxanthomonas sp. GM95 TaxID=1881043 RepID=UPI0008D5E9FA|nr:ATP-binding protein [Pseudoxanthomonas sp. GM95]SEM11385.1 His Kinase A (phospho-acceptor) domain-containing protein [Pseudoxanthomonas sp. GM95]
MSSSVSLPTAAPDSQAHRLVRDADWETSPLGARAQWPAGFKRLLTFILESPEPMWFAWGPQMRFFFNDAYLPMLGNKLTGAMGERLDVVWRDVWDDVSAAIAKGFNGEASRFTDLPLLMDRDGNMKRTFWTFSYSPVRGDDNQVAALFCVASEQTERVLSELEHASYRVAMSDQAREAQRQLMNAREQLRQAQKLEAIGQLTGGVAHDFNNLLQVITGSVELLRRDDLPAEKRTRFVEAIGGAAQRAAKLTNQLLAFSRRQTLTPEVFDLGASMRELADIVRTLAGSRIAVTVEVPDAPISVLIDRNQLDTAIINLAANARDAMKGAGALSITVQRVTQIPPLRNHPTRIGDYVAITVRDQGHGVAVEHMERIFEPFFTTKGVGEGTGLGLSQVFGFVKQSHGDIAVSSPVGEGTAFTLYLPCVDREIAKSEAPVTPVVARDSGQTRLLIVEDNASVAEFVTSALSELGYAVVLAHTGEQAVHMLGERGARFDAVFSDVVMPGINGLELGRHIRQHHPGLPVLLTSGYSDLLAKDAGHGFEVLKKPYSIEQLAQALRAATQR